MNSLLLSCLTVFSCNRNASTPMHPRVRRSTLRVNNYVWCTRNSKRAEVKEFGFHALRRYVASVLADEHKVSAKTIQRILRHKSVTTTERYIQNINRDLVTVMNMLSNDEKGEKIPYSQGL